MAAPKDLTSLKTFLIERSCPSDELWSRILSHAENIRERISKLVSSELGLRDDKVVLLGSVARGTFTIDEYDIDIFMRFDPALELDFKELIDRLETLLLKEKGVVRVGRRYAEHPYLEAVFSIDGVDEYKELIVNIVPSYETNYPNWKTPVDRSYHHHLYVNERIDGLRCDVSALKYIFKKLGVYGAEARVGGFSGYLCELLTIHYGGLIEALEAISRWSPPVIIDIEGYYEDAKQVRDAFGDVPVIVVDPVDRGRNVASALTWRSFSLAVSGIKHILRRPYIVSCRSKRTLPHRDILEGLRGIVLKFRHGEKVEDLHYPQMKRFLRKLSNVLSDNGFTVIRRAIYTDNKSKTILIILLDALSISPYALSRGPEPFRVDDEKFLSKNRLNPVWMGEDGRWYVLKKRRYSDVVPLILEYALSIVKSPPDVVLDEVLVIPDNIGELMRDPDVSLWIREFIEGDGYWRFLL